MCDVPGFENAKMKLLRHVSFVDCPVSLIYLGDIWAILSVRWCAIDFLLIFLLIFANVSITWLFFTSFNELLWLIQQSLFNCINFVKPCVNNNLFWRTLALFYFFPYLSRKLKFKIPIFLKIMWELNGKSLTSNLKIGIRFSSLPPQFGKLCF